MKAAKNFGSIQTPLWQKVGVHSQKKLLSQNILAFLQGEGGFGNSCLQDSLFIPVPSLAIQTQDSGVNNWEL